MSLFNSSSQYPDGEEPDVEPAASSSSIPNSPKPSSIPRGKFGMFSGIQSILTYAFLFATLFTLFTPDNLFSGQMLTRVFEAWQANPTTMAPLVTEVVNTDVNRIGIVSGHWKNDSGSVCSNGLTEEQVNLRIASLVQSKLTAEGFQVDLLEEFDPRLSQYKAIALVSIHADSCDFLNDAATGYKVAAALDSAYPEKATRLTMCLVDRYGKATGLQYKTNTTIDMTSYHAFGEINTETTAAIIEAGYLNLDQQILTQKPDVIAQGIVDGLLCFIRNENVTPIQTTETIVPTQASP
ncbi:MAG: N-acetylmuramoyl-L-alanine amidase family protein [Anaerolineaceae bacterium]